MKKIILVLVTVLLIIAVSVPFYSGKKAHEALDLVVAQMNVNAPGCAAWVSYDQGWFQSQALVHFNVATCSGLPIASVEETLLIPLFIDLHQGPVIFDQGLELSWFKSRLTVNAGDDSRFRKAIQVTGDGPLFLSTVRVALTGLVTTTEATLPFSVTTKDSVLTVGQFHGFGIYQPLGAFTYQINLPSAAVQERAQQWLMEGAEISLKAELGNLQNLSAIPGQVNIKLKKFNVINGDAAVVTLEESEVTSVLALATPPAANIQLRLSAGKAQAFGDSLTNIIGDISLQNVNLSFYEKFKQLQHNSGGQPVSGMQMLTLVNQELISFGPELQVKQVAFTLAEGQMALDGFIRVPVSNQQQPTNPFAVLGQIAAQFNWVADKPIAYKLFELSAANAIDQKMFASGEVLDNDKRAAAIKENAAAQINLLLMQRYIIDKDKTFEAKLSLEKGKAIVNDQIIPLPF